MITTVEISKRVLKKINGVPKYIQEKLLAWALAVRKVGLAEVRKRTGWHDEPLQGDRRGQRSIRLNKQWRAIYIIRDDGNIELIEIIEVMPHDN